MKKWYKDHLDKTKKSDTDAKKTGHSFGSKQTVQKSFRNPVLASKLKRSKTDSR